MTDETLVRIGSGGMGEVYKVWDEELERYVAVKYLRHQEPELVDRLLREARAQARVDHPAVCQVYHIGEHQGRSYIAMQYVDGVLLNEAARTWSLEQKVLVMRQVAEAVHVAPRASEPLLPADGPRRCRRGASAVRAVRAAGSPLPPDPRAAVRRRAPRAHSGAPTHRLDAAGPRREH